MKQERLKILSLLEEGKITAEDAAMLLEKLKGTSESPYLINEDTAEQVEEKFQKFAKSAEGFAKEFGSKVENAYRDAEPKLKQVSQIVLEKTAKIIDEISSTIHDNLDKNRESVEGSCCGKDEACCKEEDDTPREN